VLDADTNERFSDVLCLQVFDVVAQKGELWLARNQDDPSHTIGWIWEKHFAKLMPDDS